MVCAASFIPLNGLAHERSRKLSSRYERDGVAGFPPEMYFIVFCSTDPKKINTLSAELSLVADQSLSVYAEWTRTYRENIELFTRLKAYESAPSPPSSPGAFPSTND